MSEPAKGLLLVPIPSENKEWMRELARKVLSELGGIQHIQQTFDFRGLDHIRNDEEQVIEFIASFENDNVVSNNFAGFWLKLWIFRTKPGDAYKVLNTDVPRNNFSNIQGDPMRVEAFAARWIHLCEAVGAEAAYFVESTHNSIDEVVARCQTALQQEDIEGFLWAELPPWRGYLSPALAARWRKKLDLSWANRVETLPSGALLISSGRGYNPELGDFDAPFNASFLREQLEQHLEIAGCDHLLDIVRQQEKRLTRIMDDKDYSKHGEDAYYDWEGLKEARIVLDEVRATWVCTLRRPGLVGVQQSFTGRAQQSKVVVPVVAAEGGEWLIATLLYPFDRDTTHWNDPQKGLRAQVQRLLDAAQSQPTPPRVVVYFWRGVSADMREALIAMEADVEVADSLPLLS